MDAFRRDVAPCSLHRQKHRFVALGIVLLLALAVSGPAAAHRPLFAQGRGESPEDAVLIKDPAVSHVVYFELTPEAPYFWFAFASAQFGRVPVQVAVPAPAGRRDARPVLVLYYPDSWAQSAPAPPVTPARLAEDVASRPESAAGATIVRPASDPRVFDEPVTGTTSWIFADTEAPLPDVGTYYGVVYDESGRGGKFWIALGRRERFTWRDVWRLPETIQEVRRFHDVAGRPAWMWAAGGIFVGVPPFIGWMGRRWRQRLS